MATTWANTVLAKVSDVQLFATDIPFLPSTQDGSVTRFIQDKINLVKDYYIKPALIERFTRLYPDTVERWIQAAEGQLDRQRERTAKLYDQSGNRYIIPDIGYTMGYLGATAYLPFFMDWFGAGMPPRTYYSFGPPTNGTSGSFVNTAESGSFLVDTRYRQLYINRGTRTDVLWQQFSAEGLIDYISNADYTSGKVLLRTACCGTIWRCLCDSEMRNRATYDQNVEALESLVSRWGKQYESALQQDQTLLLVDIDGSGTISEYERTRLRRGTAWIA